MARAFNRANGAQIRSAQKKVMRSDGSNMEENTFRQGEWTPIFGISGTNTKRYAPGYGFRNRDDAEGFADFDIVDSGTNNVTGDGRWVLYESTDRDVPLVIGEEVNLASLRNSKSASLTDKLIHPGKVPRTAQDRELVFEVKVDNSTNDGNTYSKSNSSIDEGLPYSQYRV